MQKTIRINSIDYTSYVTKYGYSVRYSKIDGGAGGVMLDGQTTTDTIAIKAVVTVPLMPLLESQLNSVIAQILSVDYPTLRYYDPRTNAYRTINTIMDEPEMRHVGTNCFNNELWLAGTLTFTEK